MTSPADTKKTVVKAEEDKPQFYRVVLTHPNLNGRTVFRSVSEIRAKNWLKAHYPRGSEAHLVTPTGEAHHYEAERTGEKGADIEQWQPFDPESWTPIEQTPAPGQDAWSDTEG
jgi:hypothetical protein